MPTVPYNNELPKKYNPKNTSSEILKSTFSIRLKEYEKILNNIKQSSMDHPEQHYIIQGVRGSGKTTLLTRLNLAIEEDNSLSKWLIPIQLNEEEYGINNLFNLWLQIAEDLEEKTGHLHLFNGLSDDIETIEADTNNEAEIAFKVINNQLVQQNKKLIIFIDNIAELFDHFNPQEKVLLREILSQNNNLRIIGGSAIPLEFFYDHKDPFYQFFKVITLKELTKLEAIKLLNTLGETAGKEEAKKIKAVIKNTPEKIESIRRLTGGIPRTIALLFDILAEGPQGKSFQYLDHVLDMATPIYKHRLDDLSAQQKPIINAIAKHWDAISAKEIAKKTRISSKNISAQLAQLQNQWIIEKIPTGTKNHLYRLQERFFNIWYLMRYGRRKDRIKMRWLTQFLEIWCTPEEMRHRVKQFNHELHATTYHQGAVAYATALIGCNHIGIAEKESVHYQLKSTLEKEGKQDLLKQLPNISSDEYFNGALSYYQKEQFEDAIKFLEKSAEQGEKIAFFNIALIYDINLNNIEQAEKYYLLAIDNGVNDAYLNLGILYSNNLNDYHKAEKYYLLAIENGDNRAYLNLGNLYCDKLNDYRKAEEYYLLAIENGINEAFNLTAWFYFTTNNIKHARLALDYAKKAVSYISGFEISGFNEQHTLASVALWNNDFALSKNTARDMLQTDSWKDDKDQQAELVNLFLFFLAKEQTQVIDQWIKTFHLKDQFTPLYYTLMHLMKDEYPNEYLRMGSEMEETVKEMLVEVEHLREKYS